MGRQPVYEGGTVWFRVPLPLALGQRIMAEHGGDGRRAGKVLAELLVAAMEEIAAGIRPANEVPA